MSDVLAVLKKGEKLLKKKKAQKNAKEAESLGISKDVSVEKRFEEEEETQGEFSYISQEEYDQRFDDFIETLDVPTLDKESAEEEYQNEAINKEKKKAVPIRTTLKSKLVEYLNLWDQEGAFLKSYRYQTYLSKFPLFETFKGRFKKKRKNEGLGSKIHRILEEYIVLKDKEYKQRGKLIKTIEDFHYEVFLSEEELVVESDFIELRKAWKKKEKSRQEHEQKLSDIITALSLDYSELIKTLTPTLGRKYDALITRIEEPPPEASLPKMISEEQKESLGLPSEGDLQ